MSDDHSARVVRFMRAEDTFQHAVLDLNTDKVYPVHGAKLLFLGNNELHMRLPSGVVLVIEYSRLIINEAMKNER